jgi:hypothetical protein
MNYAVFKCATHADKKVKHSQDCTTMIRCAIGSVSSVSRYCRWCQAGTAYYANGSLQRSREELKK